MGLKRLISIFLCLAVVVVAITGCTDKTVSSQKTMVSGTILAPGQTATGKIALLVLEEQQQSKQWQEIASSVNKYAAERGILSNVYTVTEDEFDDTLQLAEKSGVELVILLGDEMRDWAEKYRFAYSEMSFLLLNTQSDWTNEKDTVVQQYSYEQIGWLAGYTAVQSGKENLACLFTEIDSQEETRAYLGFLLGAQFAAEEMGLSKNTVKVYISDKPTQEIAQKEWIQQQFLNFKNEQVETVFLAPTILPEDIKEIYESRNFSYIISNPESSLESLPTEFQVKENWQSVLDTLLAKWQSVGKTFSGNVVSGISNTSLQLLAGQQWQGGPIEEYLKKAETIFVAQKGQEAIEQQILAPYKQNGVLPSALELTIPLVELRSTYRPSLPEKSPVSVVSSSVQENTDPKTSSQASSPISDSQESDVENTSSEPLQEETPDNIANSAIE